MNGVMGIDVSHFQGDIDWSNVAAAGKRFAIIKASEGMGTDSRVAQNWAAAKAAGLLRGAYHFFRYGEDPVRQAETFLNVFQGDASYGDGDLPPALDLEWSQSGSTPDAGYGPAVAQWLETVARSLGKAPMIYTSRSFWAEVGNPSGLSQYRLWVAEYGVSTPRLPAGWSSYAFWQYSGEGSVEGISTACDLDVFNGTEEQLEALTRS